MGNRGDGGVVRLEGERRDVLESRAEHRGDVLVGDVENRDVEDVAVVVHEHRFESVEERGDSELAEERGGGGGHLVALGEHLDVGEDLDRTLVDLGGDVERLEEVGLRGFHAGGACFDGDVDLRDGASLGGRGDDKLLDLLLDGVELPGGEDDADVADHLFVEGHPGVVALASSKICTNFSFLCAHSSSVISAASAKIAQELQAPSSSKSRFTPA